jgi:hypothetical protein
MRLTLSTLILTFFVSNVFAQWEVSTGYAVNKNLLDGLPVQIAYDIKVKERVYTKPQIGYKYLYHFNRYVGAALKVNILEFHQTLSYEVIKKNRFILKPNIGLNYRFYYWKGEMSRPYDVLPQRVYQIEFRDDRLRLNSFAPTIPTDGNYTDQYSVSNFGLTFQIQSQFKINKRFWVHLTPFLEPDYDGIQTTGGCYAGIIFK